MTMLHLLVEDDFIESFVGSLAKDRITIVEKDFQNNKEMLQDVMKSYKDEKSDLTLYSKSMKDIDSWLKERES